MTVHAVKRCSSLFRFGGVPWLARASRAAAKKISTLRVVFFLRRPCQPPRYGAWNRRQHAQSVVTRGFSCAAPDPLFSAVRCAHLFRGAQPPLLSRRAAVSPRWWRQAKRQGRCCFYSKVIRRICLCHLTARRPHAALDAYVFCQRRTVIKRDCL